MRKGAILIGKLLKQFSALKVKIRNLNKINADWRWRNVTVFLDTTNISFGFTFWTPEGLGDYSVDIFLFVIMIEIILKKRIENKNEETKDREHYLHIIRRRMKE